MPKLTPEEAEEQGKAIINSMVTGINQEAELEAALNRIKDQVAELEEQEKEVKSEAVEFEYRWRSVFDVRQRRLIENCRIYDANDPAGVPGHNLMLIIAEMSYKLDRYEQIIRETDQ